ncbi:hypothetical protein [uncultured Clostridium sp.]|jgi:hypothetical protein|uniref:hypothetical protein n=1 Tax=uncultured Clostridium sp. TaxID=59620 RepID=UPI002611D85F|nr:hypothetical protein [uncultured Clostridium sp.]
MEKLEYWHTYINKNLSEPIMVDDEILRVTLTNQGKSKISAFFTFRTKIEILEFIKEVILPSVTISSFNPSENVSIYLREHSDVMDVIDIHTDYFNKKISTAYINSYKEIDEICKNNIIRDKEIKKVIETIENSFDVYNEVYITLDYAEKTKQYLRNFIDEYKKYEGLDSLELQLKENDLSVEKIENIIADIFNNENGIRELVLDRLPS